MCIPFGRGLGGCGGAEAPTAPSSASTAPACAAPAGNSALWADFVAARKEGREPILADFSYAGYRYSEQPIPDARGPVFNVTDHGAFPDDRRHDDAGIQAAINAASAAGGGVVFFPAGQFLVSPSSSADEVIRVRSGRIVLRGAGSGEGGTEVLMMSMKPGTFMFDVSPAGGSSSTLATINADVARESFWVQVDTPSALRVGQWVQVRYQSTAYNSVYFAPLALSPEWERVYQNGVSFNEPHRIAEIVGNRVRFTEPLHFSIKMNASAFTLRSVTMLEEIGVEDIRFTGSWDTYPEEFVHHKDAVHDGGWMILSVKNAANSWIRRCEFRHVNNAIYTDTTAAFTIDAVRITGKKGHSSIGNRRGYGLLVRDSEDPANTHHGPGLGYNSVGVVYLRHRMPRGQQVDSHGGVPHTSLFDQVTGGVLDGNGGPYENYPHHGRHLVFWNFQHRSSGSKSYDFWNTASRGSSTFALPIFAGFTADRTVTFRDEAAEVQRNESFGTPVTPPSLFEAQLAWRLCR